MGIVEIEKLCEIIGGRCWFSVETKSFEISVKETGGKLRGVILERSKGCSSWIHFRHVSLECLLQGVEECCRVEIPRSFANNWEEEGRKYRLEQHTNGANCFLLCSV